MFLGYTQEVKGYRVWTCSSEKLEVTRSVTFQEKPKPKYVQVVETSSEPTDMQPSRQVEDVTEDEFKLPVSKTSSGNEPVKG